MLQNEIERYNTFNSDLLYYPRKRRVKNDRRVVKATSRSNNEIATNENAVANDNATKTASGTKIERN